jgi:hypothetical protein
METIELGDRVKDKITGLKGIVIGITNWLYGCQRCTVQPEEAKDGKPAEVFHVDTPQLTIVEKRAVERPLLPADPHHCPHGPREDATRRQEVTR